MRAETLPGIDRTHIAWVAWLREPVPRVVSSLIGDCVHNLRAALDLMACDLVRLNGGSDENVNFPFPKHAKDFDREINRKNMNRASLDVVELIKTLQPYEGGNKLLRAIHVMDIQDKHRALLPTIGMVSTPAFTTTPYSKNLILRSTIFSPMNTPLLFSGQPITLIPDVINLPVGTEIPSAYSLVFDQNTPLQGSEIIESLHSLANEALSIINAFQVLCADRQFPIISEKSWKSRDIYIFVPGMKPPENKT